MLAIETEAIAAGKPDIVAEADDFGYVLEPVEPGRNLV